MGSKRLIFTDYDCFEELGDPTGERPPLVVSFDEDIVTGRHVSGVDTAHIESYVDDPSDLISDADYTLMREWLSGLWSHRGIDGGLLIQNSFIFLFAKQFVRQFRLVKGAIESEAPDTVTVYTEGRPIYDFFEVGDERLHVPILMRLCSHFDIPLTVERRVTRNRIADTVFRAIGPPALRLTDTATDGITKYQSDSPGTNAEILLHLANTNNLDVIAPVLDELDNRDADLLVTYQSHGVANVGRTQIETVRDTAPFPVSAFESFGDRSIRQQVRHVVSGRHREWQRLDTDASEQAGFVLDDVPVWQALRDQFWLYYGFHFPRVRCYIETATDVLETVDPSAVLVKADGPTPVRTMVNVANERSIPTVLVQHGLEKSINDYVPDARHIAVWGEQSKAFFEAKGISDDRLHVTGAPHFDYLQSYECDETAVKANLGIPDGNDVVMLASQVFDDAVRRKLVDAAVESVSRLEDVSLILRPHPREDRALHVDAAESAPANVVVAPDVNIHDILTTSDVLLAIRSTVILEACLLGTPVLLLTFTAEGTNPFYSADNGFPEIDDPDDLAPQIESVLGSAGRTLRQRQPSFGRQFAHNADGGATDRIVDLIVRVSNR